MQISTIFIISLLAGLASIMAVIATAYNLWQLKGLNNLKKNFFTQNKEVDLVEMINTVVMQIRSLKDEQLVTSHSLATLENNFNFSIQKVGVIRFNPFGDSGGNLSFTLAMLNRHNTGVVLTSMHGREQNRIYAKKITNGLCDTMLTQEEQQAITSANTP